MEHSFFPTTTTTRFESFRLLSLAETHLSTRDYSTAKSLATRARDTDPSALSLANQLLAVIDTLLSLQRRIANNLPDYYSILNLSPHNGQNNNAALISEQFKSLVRLLHPTENKYQFAGEAFRAVLEAYDVLSNPAKKAGYDKELAFYLQQQRSLSLGDGSFGFRIPTVDQTLVYFGGANAAAIGGTLGNVVNVSTSANVGVSVGGGGNFVHGFSAFVSNNNNSVPVVVDGNGTNGGGTQSFMGILGMNDNVSVSTSSSGGGVNNCVQGFSSFVSSSDSVPVVDGNGMNENGMRSFMGMNDNVNVGTSASGGDNFVQGFSAFVSSSNSVPVVDGNGRNENGMRSFMGILGMNDNVGNNDDQVQDFTGFVSSSNAVPVVEGNGMDGVYVDLGEINRAFMNAVGGNQDIVKETNVDYANAGEINGRDVNVVEENQGVVNETNVEGLSSDGISFPDVNVVDETHDMVKETNEDYWNVEERNGTEVNVDGDEVMEEGKEETRDDETGNGGVEGTFWTACPYCCCMFEYPGVYADCCLRCETCKSAFQGVAIASPPPIVEREDGKEGYYCCWSFFPVGIRGESWDKLNGGSSGWTPFSPMFAQQGMVRKERSGQSAGPRVYFEDDVDYEDDEAWMESSESEEFDDVDWNKEYKKKKVLNKRVTRSANKIAQKAQVNIWSEKKKKVAITPSRSQPSRAAKKSGQE